MELTAEARDDLQRLVREDQTNYGRVYTRVVKKGVPQSEVARQLGISSSTVSAYANAMKRVVGDVDDPQGNYAVHVCQIARAYLQADHTRLETVLWLQRFIPVGQEVKPLTARQHPAPKVRKAKSTGAVYVTATYTHMRFEPRLEFAYSLDMARTERTIRGAKDTRLVRIYPCADAKAAENGFHMAYLRTHQALVSQKVEQRAADLLEALDEHASTLGLAGSWKDDTWQLEFEHRRRSDLVRAEFIRSELQPPDELVDLLLRATRGLTTDDFKQALEDLPKDRNGAPVINPAYSNSVRYSRP